MKTLLQLNSSLYAGDGQSSRIASQFVALWRAANPGATVLVRDLAREPVPHLDAERFAAFLAKEEARDASQQAVIAYSDTLIGELQRADVIVLGLPMYNFGLPSTLKAYFDHVARAGITFRYTDHGPVGLLTGKQAYVFAARGGQYAGTPRDTQTPYVRDFLRFLGIDEVEFVYAEGLAIGDASRQAALAQAQSAIRRMAEGTALAA
ncbi:MAG TPA: NAD(P)H-dependent oxidoreductase [Burkholderiales bacterium]|nr:NAD(P)H-dependent oxidoreductase [Burkholderiales bacterium]